MKENNKEWVQFYLDNNLRPIPVYGIKEGCTCEESYKEKCMGQCVGKRPKFKNWADKDLFCVNDFNHEDNVALAMGKQPDGKWLLGIDIDGEIPHSMIYFLPETVTQKSGRGFHLIYEVTPNTNLGNWKDIFLTRDKTTGKKSLVYGACDLRYARGALIVAPSIHRSGTPYIFTKWQQPTFLESWMVKAITKKYLNYYDHIKRYPQWSMNPEHKNKKP